MAVRTRFAPSPTGYLHIGGARTALYAYLFARKHRGCFALRIEDTDLERSTQASVDAILQAMDWLGLDYDEGPIYQTQRLDRYREVAERFLKEGQAYRCTCSSERLEAMREAQRLRGEKPRYDGHCRAAHHPEDQPHVLRFAMPLEGSVSFEDLVRGPIEIQNAELDDFVLVRSDGMPTYNFCVVVDDLDMNMTHVLRGDDHISNTPKQLHLFQALKAKPPIYGHVPMILGGDGQRLSKRHGAVSVMQYREEGYLPEALLNYLVRLGWSHGDQEIFSREEMIEFFDPSHLSKSPARFDVEKLQWLNQHYLKTLPLAALEAPARLQFEAVGIEVNQGPSIENILILQRERVKTLRELAELSRYFYEAPTHYDEASARKAWVVGTEQILKTLKAKFEALVEWTAPSIHQAIQETVAEHQVGFGKVGLPLRVAITGAGQSPPMDAVCALLTPEEVGARLQRFMRSQG